MRTANNATTSPFPNKSTQQPTSVYAARAAPYLYVLEAGKLHFLLYRQREEDRQRKSASSRRRVVELLDADRGGMSAGGTVECVTEFGGTQTCR